MSTTISPDPISDPSRRTATAPAPGVMVVESNEWLRSRLCELLQTEPGFRLAGVAESAEEAMSMAERERFDLAVVGHRPPVGERLQVVPRAQADRHPARGGDLLRLPGRGARGMLRGGRSRRADQQV